MHPTLKSFQRAFSISLEGIREAVLAIGERVTFKVQVGKLHLQAEDANDRLREAYESLGASLYSTRAAHQPEAFSADAALQICERIRAEQRTLQEIRDRMASRYDDGFEVPLLRLQEDLKEGGGTVERVTISPDAQVAGKRLGDLTLPDGVRIILIRRGESLVFPSASSTLNAGDQVTIVGARSAVPSALQTLRT
jgi:K+/H+ antiporter YhaU regulatory subunit KhtT